MDLAIRKYNLIQELTTVDESVIEKLEKILKINKKSQDWYLKLDAEEKLEIEIGIKEADKNQLISHEDIMKKFSKWH